MNVIKGRLANIQAYLHNEHAYYIDGLAVLRELGDVAGWVQALPPPMKREEPPRKQ